MKNLLLNCLLVLLLFIAGSALINTQPLEHSLSNTITKFENDIGSGETIRDGYANLVIEPEENIISTAGRKTSEVIISGLNYFIGSLSEIANGSK